MQTCPSGLRSGVQVAVRKCVGSNPTVCNLLSIFATQTYFNQHFYKLFFPKFLVIRFVAGTLVSVRLSLSWAVYLYEMWHQS